MQCDGKVLAGPVCAFPGTQQHHGGGDEETPPCLQPSEMVPQILRTEVPLQKPEGPLLTKAGGLSINKWEIMILITSSLVLIELS